MVYKDRENVEMMMVMKMVMKMVKKMAIKIITDENFNEKSFDKQKMKKSMVRKTKLTEKKDMKTTFETRKMFENNSL